MIFEVGDLVVGKEDNGYSCTNENCLLKVTQVLEDHKFKGIIIYHKQEKYAKVIGYEMCDDDVPFKVKDFKIFDEWEDYDRLGIYQDIKLLIEIAELKNEIFGLQKENESLKKDIVGMGKEVTKLRSRIKRLKDALD